MKQDSLRRIMEVLDRDRVRFLVVGGLAVNAHGLLRFTVDDYVASGDTVVMVGSCAWRNRRTERVFETPKVDVWMFRNGRAVEIREFFDTARAVEAAAPAD